MSEPGRCDTVTARVLIRGPQAPLPGDALALPVYVYEVVVAGGGHPAGERLLVAHLEADADDPAFARGRVRRLDICAALPTSATLLHGPATLADPGHVWYCARSEAAIAASPTGDPA